MTAAIPPSDTPDDDAPAATRPQPDEQDDAVRDFARTFGDSLAWVACMGD